MNAFLETYWIAKLAQAASKEVINELSEIESKLASHDLAAGSSSSQFVAGVFLPKLLYL